jgi:hypothetical protein
VAATVMAAVVWTGWAAGAAAGARVQPAVHLPPSLFRRKALALGAPVLVVLAAAGDRLSATTTTTRAARAWPAEGSWLDAVAALSGPTVTLPPTIVDLIAVPVSVADEGLGDLCVYAAAATAGAAGLAEAGTLEVAVTPQMPAGARACVALASTLRRCLEGLAVAVGTTTTVGDGADALHCQARARTVGGTRAAPV